MARRKVKRTIEDVRRDIYKSYCRWSDVYKNGCTDPSYEDGTNLDLVRNHIIGYKNELEKLCGDKFYLLPDEYYWPTPPHVPPYFMAVSRRINCKGPDIVPATPEEERPKVWWLE